MTLTAVDFRMGLRPKRILPWTTPVQQFVTVQVREYPVQDSQIGFVYSQSRWYNAAMKDLIQQIADLENEYDDEANVIFSKFLKRYGENYTQDEFLEFLRMRYEAINKSDGPDAA